MIALGDEVEVTFAQTERASRAARPPSPSEVAKEEAWKEAARLASHFENDKNLTRIVRVQPTVWRQAGQRAAFRDSRRGRALSSKASSSSSSIASTAIVEANDEEDASTSSSSPRPVNRLPHILSLHSRSIDSSNREPSFLSYEPVLPQIGTQLVQAALRSNSVRCSVVNKQPSQGGSMQTPRINLQTMTAAWASQCTSVVLSLAAAKHECEFGNGIKLSNLSATNALEPCSLVDPTRSPSSGPKYKPFLLTSTSRLLPHALSTRLCSHSFIDTMKSIARNEMEMGVLSQLVPQRSDSLVNLCQTIAMDVDGINVWSSWVLLCFMLDEPRLRPLVQLSPITDIEASTARVFQNYGRSEVTRRARLDANASKVQAEEKAKKASKASAPGTDPSATDPSATGPSPTGTASSTGTASVEIGEETLDRLIQQAEEEEEEEQDSSSSNHQLTSMMSAISHADQALMAAKKKRTTHGTMGGGADASSVFLNYWDAVIRSSRYVHILKSLITQSRQAASLAAAHVLSSQSRIENASSDALMPLLNQNSLLMTISTQNAIRSAKAVSSLVVTTREMVPRIVIANVRSYPDYQKIEKRIGIVRSSEDSAHTTIHASRLAPMGVQPQNGIQNHTVSVWSLAIRNTTPKCKNTTLVPGVVESHRHRQAVLKDCGKATGMNRFRVEGLVSKIKERAKSLAHDGDLDVTINGIARGFIVLRAKLVVSGSQIAAGKAIAEDVAKMASLEKAGRSRPLHISEAAIVTADCELTRMQEPFATPGNNLGLGLQVNETVRYLMKNKTHRGDPCRHFCGVATASEMQEASVDEFDKPATLLPIVDVSVDFLDAPSEAASSLNSRRDACLRTTSLTLTVGGDCPVRVTDLIRKMVIFRSQIKATSLHALKDRLSHRMQSRSLLLASIARASEMNDVALHTTSGCVNSDIASAKRLTINDFNLNLMMTPWQVFRTGLSNIPESFSTTPWCGVYGSGFEIGTSGGLGIRASALTADKRNHGKLLSTQSQVDEFCKALSKVHYQQTSSTSYSAIPKETRGIPHYTVPGLHSYLDDYFDALESARLILGISERRTKDSLQCLPFSPYSERLSPYTVEDSNAKMRFRNPEDNNDIDGKAFLVDATCSDVSILREPLISRASMSSVHDNVFASPRPFVASFFLSASGLALLAKYAFLSSKPWLPSDHSSPKEEVAFLKTLIDAFHSGSDLPSNCDHLWAADAMLLISTMFPFRVLVSEPTVPSAYSKAPSRISKVMTLQVSTSGKDSVGAPIDGLGLGVEEVEEAKKYWAAFCRADYTINAWKKIEPLLVDLLHKDGSFDNSIADLDRMSAFLETAIRGRWFVDSENGTKPPSSPSPLCGVGSHAQVRAHHLKPVFFGGIDHRGEAYTARGSSIGLPAMGLQQILNLMIGSVREETVAVQYKVNIGQLCFRVSSVADIFTNTNKERSSKSVSAVGVDGDELAFGCRSEKLKMCGLQRKAFAENLDLIKPLVTGICPPKPDAYRARGDWRSVQFIRSKREDYLASGLKSREEIDAEALFATASGIS